MTNNLNEHSSIFNLGEDLWFFKSPYTLEWIFHHPLQNIQKPKDKSSVVITVRNENSIIIGIQNVKWDENERIIFKNKVSYSKIKNYDYEFNGVFISHKYILEHEIIDITYDKENEVFNKIKRQYSQIEINDILELSLDNNELFGMFDNYCINMYLGNPNKSLVNKRPIDWDLGEDYDPSLLSMRDSLPYLDKDEDLLLPTEEIFESIDPTYNNDGKLVRVRITKKDGFKPFVEEYPQYLGGTGIQEIDIDYYYLNNSDFIKDIDTNCYIENYVETQCLNEKISFHFDILSKINMMKPGPIATTVISHDKNISIWKYLYDEENRLFQIQIFDTKQNISNIFTIAYSFE